MRLQYLHTDCVNRAFSGVVLRSNCLDGWPMLVLRASYMEDDLRFLLPGCRDCDRVTLVGRKSIRDCGHTNGHGLLTSINTRKCLRIFRVNKCDGDCN
jgi:hypothetical protein